MPPTLPQYLDDMQLYDGEAKLLESRSTQVGQSALILDRTIFYPQGGGQPCDVGSITAAGLEFTVLAVRYDGEIIEHAGLLQGTPPVGQHVALHVDRKRRDRNSRLQSAGHVLLNAMQNAGQSLVAAKGYHFPDGPYVEFAGTVPEDQKDGLLIALQTEVDRLVALDLPVEATMVSPDRLAEICRNVPSNVPLDRATRVVTIDGFAQPCGGTHVRSLAALRGMRVDRVKTKKGNTRVSYSLPDEPQT